MNMQFFRYVILFFAIGFPLFSSAQVHRNDVGIQIGNKLKMSQRKGLHEIISADGSGIYAIQASTGKGKKASWVYTLRHYNEDMVLVKEAELSVMEQELKYQFVEQLGGQLYVFLTNCNKKSGEESLFAQEIDKKSLETTGPLKKVAVVNNESHDGYFTHAVSADRSKLLITYASVSRRQDRQAFDLYVLDANLRQRWFKAACMPYPGKLFTTEQYKVDNEGNVYLLSTLFEDKRSSKRNGAPDYKYHLLSYKNGGEEVEEFAIRLPGKFLTDMRIVINDQQDIIGGGFYAAQDNYDIEGSYFFTIDGTSNEVVSNSIKEFDKGFVQQTVPANHLIGSTGQSSNKIRHHGFSLNDILLREDGSAVLVGEQFLVSSSTDIKRNKLRTHTRSQYFYDYSDIILVNVNRGGEISWTNKISKFQHSHDDAGRYSSYYLNLLQDTMYFFYNEGSANGGQEKDACNSKSETVMVKVDREGVQHKQKIKGLGEADVMLMPGTGLQAGGTELFFVGGGERNNRFIKMMIQPESKLTSRNDNVQ